MYCKTIFFLDTTFSSDQLLRFRSNLLRRIQKAIMTIDEKFRYEKLQYNINREAAKTSALSSGKIDEDEYLTGEEILPSDQSEMIEQTKFNDSTLRKALLKKSKIIEDPGAKKGKASKVLKPDVQQLTTKDVIQQDHLNEETKNEIERINKIEKNGKQRIFNL